MRGSAFRGGNDETLNEGGAEDAAAALTRALPGCRRDAVR